MTETTVWNDSAYDTFYYGNAPVSADNPCRVHIHGDKLILSYEQDRAVVSYSGAEYEPGHYRLTCVEPRAHATLHREDENTLVGTWVEGSRKGLWLVKLG